MPYKMAGIHPQAKHKPEAQQAELAEMGHLAHKVLAERAQPHAAEQTVEQFHDLLAAGRGFPGDLQRIGEDKIHGGGQRNGEQHPEQNQVPGGTGM